ncbi:excinuclease ABC subunit UvrC [Candidatus Magnetaquicoccus inordinatus]|uniref:excinuclease ABC subunit UvrC n=1 Tax=Candidatus Magnetaquicoccus inordinatus TaxID=2496818 RepID=UPI00102CBDA4|nr:excinuclease ABC subunit UvrC [Candidatus Magnetaquicoccus inordinatus]
MSNYSASLLEAVAALPLRPGVYRFLGDKERVLYVGKAKALKKRVSSYFQAGRNQPLRIQAMLALARNLEVTLTHTENEALILEANLIKRFRPPYNVLLKDDKSHPYLHLSTQHPFPRLSVVRTPPRPQSAEKLPPSAIEGNPGQWFGPFPTVTALRETVKWLQGMFPIRHCEDSQFNQRQRPCLNYQIKRCSGPCCGRISAEEYGRMVHDVCLFLEGKSTVLLERLNQAMWEAAEQRAYEKAARLRDQIKAIQLIQDQRRVNLTGSAHLDVVSIAQDDSGCAIQIFCVRHGINWGNSCFFPENSNESSPEEILEAFLGQYYTPRSGEQSTVPAEVVVNLVLPHRQWLSAALSSLNGGTVRLHRPSSGEKARLLQMATLNAQEALLRRQQNRTTFAKLLQDLAELLSLPQPLQRIEAYDVSHLQDTHPVGSLIVCTPSGWQKSSYRHFNLADPQLPDDTARMARMLHRRLTRLSPLHNEQKSHAESDEIPPRPDLLLLDGGRGQLNAVLQVMQELAVQDIPLCAIAKGEERNAGKERLFLPHSPEPIVLPTHSPVLFLLQRIRDEAHRFALGSHQSQRGRAQLQSGLDQIPGIGPQRKKLLLRHFGSTKAIREAGMDALREVAGVPEHVAQRIVDFFQEGS